MRRSASAGLSWFIVCVLCVWGTVSAGCEAETGSGSGADAVTPAPDAAAVVDRSCATVALLAEEVEHVAVVAGFVYTQRCRGEEGCRIAAAALPAPGTPAVEAQPVCVEPGALHAAHGWLLRLAPGDPASAAPPTLHAARPQADGSLSPYTAVGAVPLPPSLDGTAVNAVPVVGSPDGCFLVHPRAPVVAAPAWLPLVCVDATGDGALSLVTRELPLPDGLPALMTASPWSVSFVAAVGTERLWIACYGSQDEANGAALMAFAEWDAAGRALAGDWTVPAESCFPVAAVGDTLVTSFDVLHLTEEGVPIKNVPLPLADDTPPGTYASAAFVTPDLLFLAGTTEGGAPPAATVWQVPLPLE